MNYEEYIHGNVTSAVIQNPNEDWSDYFKRQGSPVAPDKTYANKQRKVTAASYMEMGPEVYVRPSHEVQMQQQFGQMQQQSIESRLAEQMREYNQSYINKMDALKKAVEPKPTNKKEAEPVTPTVAKTETPTVEVAKKEYIKPETIVKEEIIEPVEKETAVTENLETIVEPVAEEQIPEPVEVKLFPDEPEEDNDDDMFIPGITFSTEAPPEMIFNEEPTEETVEETVNEVEEPVADAINEVEETQTAEETDGEETIEETIVEEEQTPAETENPVKETKPATKKPKATKPAAKKAAGRPKKTTKK